MYSMYLVVIKGKGTSFYNIGVSRDLKVVDSFVEQPFKVELISALQCEYTRQAVAIREYLHRYFAASQTNDDWFDLSLQQAKTLKALLDDPDNVIAKAGEDDVIPRSLRLLPRLWDRLDKLARKTGSLGKKGSALGQLSWEVLLERVAQNPGLLGIIERELTGVKVSVPQKYREAVIVHPKDAKTETLAWLEVDGDKVSVRCPEKHEDFQEIVKDLAYHWNWPRWERILLQWSGDPIDRVAELGRKLLANGFCVVFPDESIREMAISGEYASEYRRWVFVMGKGVYEGWFALRWSRQDDCYDAAKQIAASQYDKPYVVVPPEQFAEVIDFAQIYKFRFSQDAFELVAQAKAIRESALIVDLEEKVDDWESMDLNIPALDWEDDDLADDINFDAPSDPPA